MGGGYGSEDPSSYGMFTSVTSLENSFREDALSGFHDNELGIIRTHFEFEDLKMCPY